MPLPSGNFSDASAGQLFVNFSGVYDATTSDFGTGSSEVKVLCKIVNDSGTVMANGVLSRLNGGCTLIVDYPGGNAVWSVSTTEISHSISGAGSVSLACRIGVRLAKR